MHFDIQKAFWTLLMLTVGIGVWVLTQFFDAVSDSAQKDHQQDRRLDKVELELRYHKHASNLDMDEMGVDPKRW